MKFPPLDDPGRFFDKYFAQKSTFLRSKEIIYLVFIDHRIESY